LYASISHAQSKLAIYKYFISHITYSTFEKAGISSNHFLKLVGGSRRAEKDREEQKVRQGVDGYEDLEQEP